MRDVAGAIHEMLRVLRPGGWLLTTGDPFRADTSEQAELAVFDSHPDVLLGVNESIPPFSELIKTLVTNEDRLDVRLVTSSVQGARESLSRRLRRHDASSETREWRFSDRKRLARASGSISIKARVRERLNLPGRNQGATALRSGAYAEVLDNYDAALTALLPILPDTLVDHAFPGEHQTKFELLNGWQRPEPGTNVRTAYRRARWFLTRPPAADALRFHAKHMGQSGASLEVQVSGRSAAHVVLGGEWVEVMVSLRAVPSAGRFVCELHANSSRHDAGFEDYRFAVKERQFV
jgi:hypothetical protein